MFCLAVVAVATLCIRIEVLKKILFQASTFYLVTFCNTEIDAELEKKFVQLLYSTVLTEISDADRLLGDVPVLHRISFSLQFDMRRYSDDALLMQIAISRRLR